MLRIQINTKSVKNIKEFLKVQHDYLLDRTLGT